MSVYINSFNMISCSGINKEDHRHIFDNHERNLVSHTLPNDKQTYVGRIETPLLLIPEQYSVWESQNNRLLLTVITHLKEDIDEALEKYGRDRFGVVAGTSTSGISDVENAMDYFRQNNKFPRGYDYHKHEMGSPSELLKNYLQISGPAYTVSCACSSGAKALAAAARLIENDICDVVLAGGVDTLCNLTLSGFSSLEVISENLCNPFSKNRNGINIGEAGAFFLLSKEKSPLKFLGAGETSDAHHHSAPHPEGKGAIAAMQQALENAGLKPEDIDYINLHGTGTVQNDAMESKAVSEVFGSNTPCSSTKGLSGHTLGAAGALEAALCCLSLEEQKTLPHIWDGCADETLPQLNFGAAEEINTVLSNSFAFGGNNCSIIIGRSDD